MLYTRCICGKDGGLGILRNLSLQPPLGQRSSGGTEIENLQCKVCSLMLIVSTFVLKTFFSVVAFSLCLGTGHHLSGGGGEV